MLRLFTLSAMLLVASAFAFGETWTGKLVDANCIAQDQSAACTPNVSTTSFALVASGKAMNLDEAGNKKAAEALKASNNGAERAKDPNALNGQVIATVTGTQDGDKIKVETIQVQ
jgi:hypothetical protein